MARRPPQRTGSSQRGPRSTERLPDRHDAKRTWSGPPYQRSQGRWSGAFDGAKHHVGTFDTPRAWGEACDRLINDLRNARRNAASRAEATDLEGLTIAQFVGEPGAGWPWRYHRNGKRKQPGTFRHHEQCIQAFLERFGDRQLKGGVSRTEARD